MMSVFLCNCNCIRYFLGDFFAVQSEEKSRHFNSRIVSFFCVGKTASEIATLVAEDGKAEIGEHDADISKEEILAQGLATPEEYALLEQYTLALFKRGTEIAAERGLILVDTKYEFGKHNGKINLKVSKNISIFKLWLNIFKDLSCSF